MARGGGRRMTKAQKRRFIENAQNIFENVDSLNAQFAKFNLPLVDTVEEGIQNIADMFQNIVDFVNGILNNFATYHQLREYTIGSKKFFPRILAKSMGLRNLLVAFF